MDNEVPKQLAAGDVLSIPKGVWHRLYQAGSTPLKIKIRENVDLK
jgi:quercetin dioxygenase-like cupin family protein